MSEDKPKSLGKRCLTGVCSIPTRAYSLTRRAAGSTYDGVSHVAGGAYSLAKRAGAYVWNDLKEELYPKQPEIVPRGSAPVSLEIPDDEVASLEVTVENINELYQAALAKTKKVDVAVSQEGLRELRSIYLATNNKDFDNFSVPQLLYDLAGLEYHHANDEKDLPRSEWFARKLLETESSLSRQHELEFLLGSICVSHERREEAKDHLRMARATISSYEPSSELSAAAQQSRVQERVYTIQSLLESVDGEHLTRTQKLLRDLGEEFPSLYAWSAFREKTGKQSLSRYDHELKKAIGSYLGETSLGLSLEDFMFWSNSAIVATAENPVVDLAKNVVNYVAGLAKYNNEQEAIFLVDDEERILRDLKRTNEEDISKLSGGEKADRDVVVRRMIMLYATAKRVDQALAQQKKDGQDVSWTFDALEGVLKSTLGLPESELETAYKTNMDYLGSQKEVENTEYLKAIGKIEAAITALGGVQDQSTKKARYQKAQAAVREFVDQHGANPREGEENIWYANTLQSFMNANFDEFTLTEQREKKYAEDLARLQNEVRGLERFKTSEGKKGAYAALQQVVTEFKEAHGTLPRAKKTDVSFIDDPLQYLLDTSYQGFIANEQRTATGLIITNTDGTPQDPRTLAQSSTNDALASLDSRISELIEERTRRLQNSDLVQVEHTVRYLTDRIAELKAEHGKHSASDVAIIKAMQAYKPIAVGEYARLRYQKPKTGTVIAEHLVAKSKEGLWTNITSEAYNVIKYGSGFAALDEIVRGTGRGLEKIKPKKGMFGLAYKLGSFGCQTLYLPISVAKWAGDFVSKLLPYNEKTFGPKHIDTKTLDGQAELVKRTGKHLLLPTDVFFLPAGTPAGTLVRLLWWAGKNSLEAVMGTDDQTAARA